MTTEKKAFEFVECDLTENILNGCYTTSEAVDITAAHQENYDIIEQGNIFRSAIAAICFKLQVGYLPVDSKERRWRNDPWILSLGSDADTERKIYAILAKKISPSGKLSAESVTADSRKYYSTIPEYAAVADDRKKKAADTRTANEATKKAGNDALLEAIKEQAKKEGALNYMASFVQNIPEDASDLWILNTLVNALPDDKIGNACRSAVSAMASKITSFDITLAESESAWMKENDTLKNDLVQVLNEVHILKSENEKLQAAYDNAILALEQTGTASSYSKNSKKMRKSA